MFELKTICEDAIPTALSRVKRYRLLDEPRVAESICLDILEVAPHNQEALIGLVLSLTDLFGTSTEVDPKRVLAVIPRLESEYDRLYYTGVIHERQGKSRLARGYPGARFDAYSLLHEAMGWFERAQKQPVSDNVGAILRWNSCARMIMRNNLAPRPSDDTPLMLE